MMLHSSRSCMGLFKNFRSKVKVGHCIATVQPIWKQCRSMKSQTGVFVCALEKRLEALMLDVREQYHSMTVEIAQSLGVRVCETKFRIHGVCMIVIPQNRAMLDETRETACRTFLSHIIQLIWVTKVNYDEQNNHLLLRLSR